MSDEKMNISKHRGGWIRVSHEFSDLVSLTTELCRGIESVESVESSSLRDKVDFTEHVISASVSGEVSVWLPEELEGEFHVLDSVSLLVVRSHFGETDTLHIVGGFREFFL